MTEIFIKKAILKHGDKYGYSKVDYKKAIEKVIIICKIHGDFLQTPNKHLCGNGCRKCFGQNKTTDDFINEAINIHKDENNNQIYDYSNTIYKKASEKVIIKCFIHGNFLQTPNAHLAGKGCSKCFGQNKTTEDFINESINIHKDENNNPIYDYSNTIYKKASEKVIINCFIHGEFKQTPNGHLDGNGCQDCGYIKTGNKKKSDTDEFIQKAIDKHKDENNNPIYNYSKVIYTKAIESVIIICKEHGEFKQQPSNHLQGQGCEKCGINKRSIESRYSTEEFIKKAIDIHKDENNNSIYNYSKVIYYKSNINITIICKKHGDFLQKPSNHLQGQGCPKCVGQNKTTDDFINDAINIHKDENNNQIYDYSLVNYINAKEKIKIICKIHGIFIQTPNSHLCHYGCPKCSIVKQHSKAQIQWLNFIQKYYDIKIQHAENEGELTIPNTKFKADGYCKETNTIYEYHGNYWHGNPKIFKEDEYNKTTKCTFGELYQKTLEKEQKIRDMSYKLITIWENDWIKLNKCVSIIQIKFLKYKFY